MRNWAKAGTFGRTGTKAYTGDFKMIGKTVSHLLIKQSLTTELTEQYLVSCNTEGWGCSGGWWAHDMLVSPGAVIEADFPYVASDVPCLLEQSFLMKSN